MKDMDIAKAKIIVIKKTGLKELLIFESFEVNVSRFFKETYKWKQAVAIKPRNPRKMTKGPYTFLTPSIKVCCSSCSYWISLLNLIFLYI